MFIDSEYETWNMDPIALEKAFEIYPDVKLIVVAHLRNWVGKVFANVAFVVDKETRAPRLTENNGRIPARVKMACMCGCNISRHLDKDIAWLLKSPDRFRTKPS